MFVPNFPLERGAISNVRVEINLYRQDLLKLFPPEDGQIISENSIIIGS